MVYWSVISLTPAFCERRHWLTCLSVQVMTSRPSSRRSPWWRSASTKTSWPTSAVTTGAVCSQPVHLMRGIPGIVGGLKYLHSLVIVRLLDACLFVRILGSVYLCVTLNASKLCLSLQEYQAVDLYGILRRRVTSGYVSWFVLYTHKCLVFLP